MRWSLQRNLLTLTYLALLTVFGTTATAESGVYQTQAEFLAEVFGAKQPESNVVWFDDELRALATDILGHPPAMLRIRYWHDDARTAWVINEVGKEKPITLGVVVENNEIQNLSVLQFRESRGWEIRYPFFTQQFTRLKLKETGALSRRIDGITGATLSVRAATRTANLALVLNDHVRRPNQYAKATP